MPQYRTVALTMARRLDIHPTHPQARLLATAADALRNGDVIIYPTDSTYALGCAIDAKTAQARIHQIRGDKGLHHLTLMCRDLSELATYARVSNSAYRLLRALTPGPYTFILQGSRELPKRILDPKRKTIGLRIPDHAVAQGLLSELQSPMLSATLLTPNAATDEADPGALAACFDDLVDVFIDAGHCGTEPTTIIDLSDELPRLVRQGRGDPSRFFNLT